MPVAGEDDEDDEHDPETLDPNRSAIWPTFPAGTRLPVRPIPAWLDWLLLAFMLAVMTGLGVVIWWFVETVRSR